MGLLVVRGFEAARVKSADPEELPRVLFWVCTTRDPLAISFFVRGVEVHEASPKIDYAYDPTGARVGTLTVTSST